MATTESEQTAMAVGATSPAEVLEFAAERGVEMVDLKFVDLPGTWQHMTLPIGALDSGDFESGLGFDGCSIRGFQEIHESDGRERLGLGLKAAHILAARDRLSQPG